MQRFSFKKSVLELNQLKSLRSINLSNNQNNEIISRNLSKATQPASL